MAHRSDPSSAARPAVSRRRFLAGGGLTVVTLGLAPGALTGCGGSDVGGATGTSGAASSGAAGGAGGAVNYLSWEGYDLPVDAMDTWRDDNQITFNTTYIGNHDDIQAKLKGGGDAVGYDLTTYFQGYKPLYQELGILTPLEAEKIPNLELQNPFWNSDLQNFWRDPDGSITGVPFTWGTLGLTYNSAEIDGLRSWTDLLDPALTGKIGTVDDPAGHLALASKILGLDPTSIPKDQLQVVVDHVSAYIAQTVGVAPSFGDLTSQLVSGEIIACYFGWAAVNTFAADAGLPTVTTIVPEEGSYSYCDAYSIPPTAQNREAALAFINQALDPQVQAESAAYLVAGVTVDSAMDLLDETSRGLYDYGDLEGLFEQAPLFSNAPVESDEFVTFGEWNDAWQAIKAGG